MLACGAAFSTWSGTAAAFCRSTACDPTQESCRRDPNTNCLTQGKPLFWASACVDLYVQADGAPSQGITWQDTQASLQSAVDTWLHTDCGGAAPSLQVNVLGPITCHNVEYNSQAHNANIVMFREDAWPADDSADAIGSTKPSFAFQGPGEIWDADIALNAFQFKFSTDGSSDSNDLQAVLTHEVGHWLGLDHSKDTNATMFAKYGGGTGLRTLDPDDEAGICALYPPTRTFATTSCEPRHGFSDLCAVDQPPDDGQSADAPGCNFSARRGSPALGSLALAALLLLASRRVGGRAALNNWPFFRPKARRLGLATVPAPSAK